jgi:hypothetical protein
MRHPAWTAVILCGALLSSAGCQTAGQINETSKPDHIMLLEADRATVWNTLVQLLNARNIQILESERDRGWLRTDYVYFHPMAFGEPVLTGTTVMGKYVDVEGGRYRLSVQLTEAGEATSVRVEVELQRLEKRPGAPPVEPSFSLDSSAGRGYVIGVPQLSNGVIERHFLDDLKQAVTGELKGPDHSPPLKKSE